VITGDTVPFRWGYIEQQAFDEVKSLVQRARDHRRVPLDYSKNAAHIWMVTDGCATGISGLVSQGTDWKTAKITAFYSAKLNSVQQNYPVHEIEMLAGIETMLRHVDILQGTKFRWLMDHRGLIHLLNQKNLSGRQARWLEKISSFTFEVVYIPGSENVISDALSWLYLNDSVGTQQARSEFTSHDVTDDDTLDVEMVPENLPVLAGIEARVVTRHSPHVHKEAQGAVTGRLETSRAFAARMHDRFVLCGPAERKEGRSTARKELALPVEVDPVVESPVDVSTHRNLPNLAGVPNLETVDSDASLLDVVSQSEQGIDLLNELCGKYGLDPAFQSIIKNPGDFHNFEVSDQIVYLKQSDKRVLCIPKTLIQGRSA